MKIKYEILNFFPDTASVIVRYFTDEFPGGYTYNVDIPLEGGVYPEEVEFEKVIMAYAPRMQIERITNLRTIEPPEYLKAYIKSPPADDIPE